MRHNVFKALEKKELLNFLSHQKLLQDEVYKSQLGFNEKSGLFGSSVYIGFDPTAESIHLGNYLGLIALKHF